MYDNTKVYYKYITDYDKRHEKKQLRKKQKEKQEQIEEDEQKRREEINQPSYDGKITSSEYDELITKENKKLWVGQYWNQHDGFSSYKKIREEEKPENILQLFTFQMPIIYVIISFVIICRTHNKYIHIYYEISIY